MSGHRCPHCGGAATAAFEAADVNRRLGNGQRFAYSRCQACKLLFQTDPPSELGPYYPQEYYAIPGSVEELSRWADSERYKIEMVMQFRTSGHLIEIGPASGGFCYLAKAAGFDVSAIEMDARSCEFLASKLSIDVTQSADEAAALAVARPADVIAMWHVLEHLVDPWTMLDAAARKLNVGGVLILATPNPGSVQMRLLGKRWAHIDAPRHLWLFPPNVLRQRGRSLGLTARLMTTQDPGSLGWNLFGWEQSLQNIPSPGLIRRAARVVGRLAARVAAPLERREGRGAAYTIVLQKTAG